MTTTLLVLYALRTLGLDRGHARAGASPRAPSAAWSARSPARRFARWVGEGRAIPLSVLLILPFAVLTPLAVLGAPGVLLAVSTFGFGWGSVAYNITQVSFRQRLCPPALLGRMNASVRFLVFGTMPLGALLGGALGSWLGIVPTLWIAAGGQLLAALPVTLSPLFGMRELPDELDETTPAAAPVGTPAAG